ncbi:hypothetical protein Tco_1074326 [Tanacetum coccineum]
MSQDPNEQGYFTHLLNPNSSYQQEIGSNPSTPSSQHSQSSSSYQQYPGFDAFQQSQPQPRFKEPQPQPPKDKRKKRVAKQATVNLVDENDEEEEPIRQCARWSREEEILLTQCWIETSENGQIGADRSEDSINDDCQKFNVIYKHLERKSEKNEADHIEAAKITFATQQPTRRKFQLEHYWRILKGHSKWDTPKPLDTEDHTKIFGPDVRPRPAGKNLPAKKTKSETTGSTGGSASRSLSDYVSGDLRRKLQAGTSAHEAKKEGGDDGVQRNGVSHD